MKVSRKWLQTYFESELPSADELAELLIRHSFEVEGVEEIKGDHIIDIDVLANRSSDCLSHRGIARELATLLSMPLKRDPLRETLPHWDETDQLTVSVEDAHRTPRYMAAVMRGVTVKESPQWLREYLEALGQRSINNIVDATNYVMLDVGQPLHAFDLSLLAHDTEQKRHIQVRMANKGEKITTLTGDTYELNTTHQVITDGVTGDPLALAGIKGGKHAEISSSTVDIVLESANFDYVNVRKTSQSLKLATDASVRFQNEPSPLLSIFALKELIALIEDVAEGVLVGVIDVGDQVSEREPIAVTLSEMNAFLGVTLTVADVEEILVRFEWEFSRNGEEFVVTGPWERKDIRIKEDVIEEVGRVYGYSNIPSKPLPSTLTSPVINKKQYFIERLQKLFLERGYSEVLTYTLVEKGQVELVNPLASDKAFMRTDLTEGVAKALVLNTQNAPLLGITSLKIFEIGTVFLAKGERLHLAVGGKALSGKQSVLDGTVRVDVEEILETVFDAKVPLQVREGVYEVPLDDLIQGVQNNEKQYELAHVWNTEARFTPWSVYPYMLRDIAVWVPAGTSSDVVRSVIVSNATDLLVRCDLFDTFEKDNNISYALHLVFQSKDRTLTDEEVGKIQKAIHDALNGREGWQVR